MKCIHRTLTTGLLIALCMAGIAAAEEVVDCSAEKAPCFLASAISSQTATPAAEITLTATLLASPGCDVQAYYRVTKEGVPPVESYVIPPSWDIADPSMGVESSDGSTVTFSQSIDLGAHHLSPGIYTVMISGTDTGTDTCGEVTEDPVTFTLVIYDPEGGFVTGGGWIQSPEGAYAMDPSLTGRANFGFVSKYLKGATVPSGQTEFQFKAGNLNFHSTSYDWLVVGGAKAQYKGTGTINNGGSYRFMLTVIDGQLPGGNGVDKFRIRIWMNDDPLTEDEIIYDNMLGAADTSDPTTAIAGGSIVIHKK